MTKQEEKQQLRRIIRGLRAQLSEAYCLRANRAIAAHLLAMSEYQAAGTAFCYVSTGLEIDTWPVLEDVLASGKVLCVPLCVSNGVMELRQVTSLAQLAPGSYGIPEPPADNHVISPDAVDFAVLPCLTCNHLGQRLGQGGGYYDRFLSHYRGGSVLLCRELLIREEIPLEPHDYPIPWVLTEKGLYEDGTPARLG